MADIRLPDIKASVKVDSKDVDAGLKRVESATKGAGKGFEGLQDRARASIDTMSSSLTSKLGPASGAAESALAKLGSTGAMMGAGVAAGAAVAGVAIAKFAIDGVNQLVALDSEIRNFQRASGASAGESSKFVAVLDDLGVKSETAGSALFKLGRKAADGGDDLTKFGIEVARAKDGTADLTGTMLNVADAYVQTTDPARRAELAFAAFGKQGQELIPVLEQGRTGLQAFFDGVKDGEKRTQEQLDATRRYELAMDDLSDTMREFKLGAGDAFLPLITGTTEAGTKVLGFLDSLKSKAPDAFEGLRGAAVGAVGGPLAQVAQLIGEVGGKSDNTKQSTKQLAEEVKASAIRSQEDATAKEAQARALDKVVTATLGTISSNLSYEQSVNTLKDNINDLDDRTKDYNDAVEKNGVNSKEAETANRALRDAHLGIETSAVSAANAAVRLADDTATAGGKALTAKEKSDVFRDALIDLAGQAEGPTRDAIIALADQVLGLPDSKTVFIDADISAAQNKLASIQRQINSVSSGAYSTSGAQQFALGMDMGPVKGRPGQAVPIIAHAGEWVVTPSQLADLRNSPSPGVPTSTVSAAAGIDYDRLAAAIAAHPPRAYVVASDVAKGLHDNRRR